MRDRNSVDARVENPGAFRPHPALRGGHLQTIGGLLLRLPLRWPASVPVEDHLVPAEGGVLLLLRASWQRGSRRDAPALLLVHGLEGCDASSYMISTGLLAYRRGWHALRLNLRGCGDSLSVCPRLYDAGLTSDLLAVLRWVEERGLACVVAGFSLGAGLSLLTLARERREIPGVVMGLAAVSPPLDMTRCADELEKRRNWIYQHRFLHALKRSYRRRQRLDPACYEHGLERGLRTLRAFDDVITARYGGYRDAEHYYARVSAGPRLGEIDRPTLILTARDDPFIAPPAEPENAETAHVRFEITRSGGHVGFAGRSRAPGFFWAADRILALGEAALARRSLAPPLAVL